jgi:predicted dehydrogenase
MAGKNGLDFLLLGCGMMGSISSHIIEQCGGRIRGVLGTDEKEVETFLARNRFRDVQIEGTLDEYKNILADTKAIDAVLIAVPNYKHAEMAIQAANAGKHLLIEKPLATNLADAKAVYEAVLANGVAAEINSQYRHHEILQTIGAAINSGEFDVDTVQMGYLQGWQASPTDAIGWRPVVEIAGPGKLVGDLGSHALQTTLHLFGGGEFEKFSGSTYNVHPKRWRLTKAGEEEKRKLGGGSVSGKTFEKGTETETLPGPQEKPEFWEEMDMLSDKYSGDDRAHAEFTFKGGNGKRVMGSYLLSQVDVGNENNFYMRLRGNFGNGADELVWWQEDPNHFCLYNEDGLVKRVERGSGPSMIGRPGGHPHGYGDAILIEVDRMMRAVEEGKEGEFSERNIGDAVRSIEMIGKWLGNPLQPYTGQLDSALEHADNLRQRPRYLPTHQVDTKQALLF